MIEEPPSTSPESNKGLGFFKKIRLFLRGLYKRVSYTPMNQKELSGVLKEAEEMNLIDKNILDMSRMFLSIRFISSASFRTPLNSFWFIGV